MKIRTELIGSVDVTANRLVLGEPILEGIPPQSSRSRIHYRVPNGMWDVSVNFDSNGEAHDLQATFRRPKGASKHMLMCYEYSEVVYISCDSIGFYLPDNKDFEEPCTNYAPVLEGALYRAFHFTSDSGEVVQICVDLVGDVGRWASANKR